MGAGSSCSSGADGPTQHPTGGEGRLSPDCPHSSAGSAVSDVVIEAAACAATATAPRHDHPVRVDPLWQSEGKGSGPLVGVLPMADIDFVGSGH